MGHKTLHPLVSVIDLSKAPLEQRTVRCDFYTITLIEGEAEYLTYGRKYYDYSNASLIFRIPGETMKLDTGNTLARKGWLLAFHPDLIACTTLESHIKDYSFFFYKLNESLHLSLREKMKIIECIRNIEEELQHAIDCHSKILISRHIELLLDYCMRFYERQFITRSESNKSVLVKFETLLDDYFQSDKLQTDGLPSVKYFADKVFLSPNYFGDLIKKETGKSAQEYIQTRMIDIAKEMIAGTEKTVSQIAYELGFQYSQHFNRIFKKNTGYTPGEYRKLQI